MSGFDKSGHNLLKNPVPQEQSKISIIQKCDWYFMHSLSLHQNTYKGPINYGDNKTNNNGLVFTSIEFLNRPISNNNLI